MDSLATARGLDRAYVADDRKLAARALEPAQPTQGPVAERHQIRGRPFPLIRLITSTTRWLVARGGFVLHRRSAGHTVARKTAIQLEQIVFRYDIADTDYNQGSSGLI